MTQLATQRWLDFMRTRRAEDLGDLLADDAVFYSRAVFSPQRGRAKAAAYLLAAEKMFTDCNFPHAGQSLANTVAPCSVRTPGLAKLFESGQVHHRV